METTIYRSMKSINSILNMIDVQFIYFLHGNYVNINK